MLVENYSKEVRRWIEKVRLVPPFLFSLLHNVKPVSQTSHQNVILFLLASCAKVQFTASTMEGKLMIPRNSPSINGTARDAV